MWFVYTETHVSMIDRSASLPPKSPLGGSLSPPSPSHPSLSQHSQAKSKASDAITAIDAEMCYNVGVSAQLNATEASTLAW